MPPSRARLLCRAPNRFSPSIALWEHFVGPRLPALRPQCFSSTASEAAHHGAQPDSAVNAEAVPALQDGNASQQPQAGVQGAAGEALKIRRMTTVKGKWAPNKVEASIEKNKMLLYASKDVALTEAEKLLAVARDAFEKSEEYEGLVVEPVVNRMPAKESALPWCLAESERDIPAIQVLDKEIERFYHYTKPTASEQLARQRVIQQVRLDVKSSLKSYDVEVFGSERNGIAFATSDIDFRLVHPSSKRNPTADRLPPTRQERYKGVQRLQALFNRTIRHHTAYLLPTIRYARYPLISAQDRTTGLDIQIVLCNDTSLSNARIQQYMDEIPYLRKLYYVVKNILDVRGLSDVFRGGFGSYSIFMMLVASIKHMPHPRQDAAGALLNFLQFYSQLDTRTHGLSIDPVARFDKKKHPVVSKKIAAGLKAGTAKPLPDYMLCLRDPADKTNDLGRKGIAIKHVQATFGQLYNRLVFDIKVNMRASLLAPLVGPSYLANIERRRKLQRHGERLAKQELAAKAKLVREADRLEA